MTEPQSTRVPARWPRRALAVALGLLLAPLALEGALRVAGLFVGGSRAGEFGPAAILCQGDSFTFGLFLPPEAAYPARLQALLFEAGDVDARVVNAGIPSKPTWVLKRELRADLEHYRPRIALLLAGINDHWRRRPDDHHVEKRGPVPRPWRIVKTWQWLTAEFGDDRAVPGGNSGVTLDATSDAPPSGELPNFVPTTAVTARPGAQELRFRDRTGALRSFDILPGEPSVEEFCGWIEEDMTVAVQIAREEGVVPVLLAYPATGSHFEPINATLERVALQNDVLFVDSRPEFRQGVQAVGRAALYFPDQHTTDVGCEVMARVALRELARAGLVALDPEDVPDPLGAIEGWTEPALWVEVVRPSSGARPTHVRVRYAPGYGAVLIVAGAEGTTQVDFQGLGDVQVVAGERPRARDLPLAADALFTATLPGNQHRTVTIGADGVGFLPIPWDALAAAGAGEREVFAAVAIVLPKVGPVLAVSAALPLGTRAGS